MSTETIAKISFETSTKKIDEGETLFLDVGPGKIGKDEKEHLGFPPVNVKELQKFCGAELTKPPILIFLVINPESFKPKTAGERWKVVVERIEVTSQLTANKKFQRVLVYVNAVERVESKYEFYDEVRAQLIVGIRSGRVSIREDRFPVEKVMASFQDKNMVMEVLNVYASFFVDNEIERRLVFQKLIGGASKDTLINERACEMAVGALKNKKHGSSKNFREQAEREIGKYLTSLPEMPRKLKGME